MEKKDLSLDDYQNKSYFELLEIATKEKDLKKRKNLFEYASKRLKEKFSTIATGNGGEL